MGLVNLSVRRCMSERLGGQCRRPSWTWEVPHLTVTGLHECSQRLSPHGVVPYTQEIHTIASTLYILNSCLIHRSHNQPQNILGQRVATFHNRWISLANSKHSISHNTLQTLAGQEITPGFTSCGCIPLTLSYGVLIHPGARKKPVLIFYSI